MEDDLSSIDSSSENALDEEDEREMLGYLSEMVFTAPFEKYVENKCNKLIKDNYNKIPPLFEQKEYSLIETIKEFQQISHNIIIKAKKKINNNNQPEISEDKFEMEQSQNLSDNNSRNKTSEGIKNPNKNNSYINEKTDDSIDDFFNKSKNFKEKDLSSITSKTSLIENIKHNKKSEINDFLDTFNLKGKEFEYHAQILLVQILKCLEKEENSFKFLRNVEIKFGKTDNDKTHKENELTIKDIELDFIVNNINNILLSEFLKYLKKNILIFKFQGKIYEINQSKNFDDILTNLIKFQNFDILGEIGLNALNDENKIKQFKNYLELLKVLKSNEIKNNNKINLFYEKTGFLRENEKLVFFVTDSKFNEIYKSLKNTKLYEVMMDPNININFVLCYLSSGINEQIILNKFIIKYKMNNENPENKENSKNRDEIEDEKEDKKNQDKKIFDKIKLTYKSFLKSEKFQISCNKINDLLIGFDNIKNKFNNSKNNDMKAIFKAFNQIIFILNPNLNIELEKYLQSKKTAINFINEHHIEEEIVVIHLKGNKIRKDIIPEILDKYRIKFITINIQKNNYKQKKIIKNIKKNNSLFKIYIFMYNLYINEEIDIKKIAENMNLKITEAHYIFFYSPYSYNTLNFNIKFCKDEKQFIEQYNDAKNIIKSYYKDLEKIIVEKKYYDIFIKIYIKKNRNYIKNSLGSGEQDLIQKINEILYFISNLKLEKNITEKVTVSDLKDIIDYINNMTKDFIEQEMDKIKFDNIFMEIKNFLDREMVVDSIKKNIKNYYTSYLRRNILNKIYDYFINGIVPKISFRIFNEKIKILLVNKNKEKNN